jgi:hypothetical protein
MQLVNVRGSFNKCDAFVFITLTHVSHVSNRMNNGRNTSASPYGERASCPSNTSSISEEIRTHCSFDQKCLHWVLQFCAKRCAFTASLWSGNFKKENAVCWEFFGHPPFNPDLVSLLLWITEDAFRRKTFLSRRDETRDAPVGANIEPSLLRTCDVSLGKMCHLIMWRQDVTVIPCSVIHLCRSNKYECKTPSEDTEHLS